MSTDDGKLHGYNEMNDTQRDTINTIKAHEENLAALWKAIVEHDNIDTDYDLTREAREHFRMGYMLLVRAVASPRDPFSFHDEPATSGEVHGG
jgi:hypothetical protein